MKRVLWFSNCELTSGNVSSTGTWLIAMMEALIESRQIELYNITDGVVKDITRRDCKGVVQWVLPRVKINRKGLPPQKIIRFIKEKEHEVNPDLIHVWGTENYWGMLAVKGILTKPVLLDMQGVLKGISQVYYGGLTFSEVIHCFGLKELLIPKIFLYFKKKSLDRKVLYEQQILRSIKHISVQSEWVRTYVEHINPSVEIFTTGIILRKEFYEANQWTPPQTNSPVLFTSCSGTASYKGLHVLLRALAVLKGKHPNIRLKIAGKMQKRLLYRDGYTNWLFKECRKLGIEDNIDWLGSLNAEEIITQFYTSSVVVIPSYVESYSLALAEAMIIGIPTVVSFAGAMPELANHNESALFFPPGDFMICALNIEKLFSEILFSQNISKVATQLGQRKNNYEEILRFQLSIYNKISNHRG